MHIVLFFPSFNRNNIIYILKPMAGFYIIIMYNICIENDVLFIVFYILTNYIVLFRNVFFIYYFCFFFKGEWDCLLYSNPPFNLKKLAMLIIIYHYVPHINEISVYRTAKLLIVSIFFSNLYTSYNTVLCYFLYKKKSSQKIYI